MSEGEETTAMSIAESLMLSRLAQSEQMRDFFLQMWAQNPILAKRAGERIKGILFPVFPAVDVEESRKSKK